MVKKIFSNFIEVMKNKGFDKDGNLSRQKFFQLCILFQEKRENLWCAKCCENVKIISERKNFLNNIIDLNVI